MGAQDIVGMLTLLLWKGRNAVPQLVTLVSMEASNLNALGLVAQCLNGWLGRHCRRQSRLDRQAGLQGFVQLSLDKAD